MRQGLYCFLLMLILLLSGCSMFSPIEDQQKQYVLGQMPRVTRHAHRPIRLMVAHPTTSAIYDTTQMAYSIKKWEVGYFAKNRWGDKPADMIQNLLIRTLEATHAFSAVSKVSFPDQNNVLLNTEIIRFEEDLTGPVPVFQVAIRVELTGGAEGRSLGARQITASRRMTTQTPYAMVMAANQAVADVLQQIEKFCIQKIHSKGKSR